MAEVDWEQRSRPAGIIAPTTHTDQARHIDWILATPGLRLVPGTFRVHPGDPKVSDHKPTSAQYELRRRP
ncbi:hypothetical protein BJF83_22875 [Nocardiopsis sp. CNR-923]|uniref:hypothetical protein n=1 Tax=Nocardiopsis sp. CNR-923 TaxID=1904965 RepID=UPI00095E5444|nr:hypothetical protein [Nocardiopsis sp. CNR-923]OLT25405.1 hypothetical protein BJF83_22875 [Nocardiopsis sp. CNR-923]